MKISDCSITQAVTCYESDEISATVKKLKKHKLRHLYVIDKKKILLGVFSGIDVIYTVLAAGKDYRKMKIKEIMKKNIVSFTKEDPLTKAIGFMSATNILSCPIIDEKKLVGVLSYKDALNYVLKQRKQMK